MDQETARVLFFLGLVLVSGGLYGLAYAAISGLNESVKSGATRKILCFFGKHPASRWLLSTEVSHLVQTNTYRCECCNNEFQERFRLGK